MSSTLAPETFVAASDPKVVRAVTRALASLGCNVESSRIKAFSPDHRMRALYVVDASSGGDRTLATLRQIRARDRDAKILLLFQQLQDPLLLEAITEHRINNLIARHGGLSARDGGLDEGELLTTLSKLISGHIFGIERYLPAFGVKVHERMLRATSDKVQSMCEFEDFLERIRCPQLAIPEIANVVDELLMNAIFNAPCDASGQPKYRDVVRSKHFALAPGEEPLLRYACDGRYLAVSVADPFGRLHRESILRYLERSIIGRHASTREHGQGAGIGLHMIFHTVSQLVFNIEADRCTEVIALFFIRDGLRGLRRSERSLNIFLRR